MSTEELAVTSEAVYRRELRAAKRAIRPAIVCAGCGQPFRPTRSNQRSCSPRCRQRVHRKEMDALA